jgi:hypothetical protein
MKKAILGLALMLLFGTAAHADGGSLDVSATADYLILGQAVDVSFSYVLASPTAVASDIVFSITGASGTFSMIGTPNQGSFGWSNDPNFSFFNIQPGDVYFYQSLEGYGTGSFIDLEMFAPGNYDAGGYLPVSFTESVTDPPRVPEPAEGVMLLASLVALALLARFHSVVAIDDRNCSQPGGTRV